MFAHVRNKDGGGLRLSAKFRTWCEHEFEDGKHLVEETDVFDKA